MLFVLLELLLVWLFGLVVVGYCVWEVRFDVLFDFGVIECWILYYLLFLIGS